MKVSVFRENLRSWLFVIFAAFCAVGTLSPLVTGIGTGVDVGSMLLTAAALILMILYFFLPEQLRIKRWFFPLGFAVFAFLQFGAVLPSVYYTIMYAGNYTMWVPMIMSVVYLVGILLCLLGSLFDFKIIVSLGIGSALNVVALLVTMINEFLMTDFQYMIEVLGAVQLSVVVLVRYVAVLLFYIGVFLLSTNKVKQV